MEYSNILSNIITFCVLIFLSGIVMENRIEKLLNTDFGRSLPIEEAEVFEDYFADCDSKNSTNDSDAENQDSEREVNNDDTN